MLLLTLAINHVPVATNGQHTGCDRVRRRCELFPTVPVEVEVLLHVYDYQGKGRCCCCAGNKNGLFRVLGAAIMVGLNFLLAHCIGLGLYHSGVEVNGREYAFCSLPPAENGSSAVRRRMLSGVTRVRPRDTTGGLPHAYRTTIPLGVALLCPQERDVPLQQTVFCPVNCQLDPRAVSALLIMSGGQRNRYCWQSYAVSGAQNPTQSSIATATTLQLGSPSALE